MPLSLLDLPTELLDRIIGLALVYKDVPPGRSLSSTQNRPRHAPKHIVWLWQHGPQYIRYPQNQERNHQLWKSTAVNLCLVNRRLAEITQLILRRPPTSSPPHILDIQLVNETDLCPTWISVPPPNYPLEDLIVTVRIVGTSPTIEGRRYRFSPSDSRPPPIVCCFLYFLKCLFECGPLAGHRDLTENSDSGRSSPSPLPFRVNRLHLNFLSPMERDLLAPSNMAIQTWLKQNNDGHRALRMWPYNTVETLLVRPDWLLDLIMNNFENLLSNSDSTNPYRELLVEHVSHIRGFVDGKLIQEIEIST